MLAIIDKFFSAMPLGIFIVACLTLGLAPFNPPHLWEKLQLLGKGQLVRPLDWFDLILHGAPWLLLIAKLVAMAKGSGPGV